jgi:ribosome biogenesis protein Tsr3
MATEKTSGEVAIKNAIKALKAALAAGDKVDEVTDLSDTASWRTTYVEIERCLAVLESKPAADLAAETWGCTA